MAEREETPGARAAAWNKARQHISNDSSLGGDEFYDAVEDVSSRGQARVSNTSSAYGSTRSFRGRSSSASTLVPNAEAAELMKLVASTNSSVKLDVSAYSTPGEYAEGDVGVPLAGPGEPFASDGRSKNPFIERSSTADGIDDSSSGSSFSAAAAAVTRRWWPAPGDQHPAKTVVMDISSAENTPATTPVHTPGGRKSGGGVGITGSSWPELPPRPPPGGDNSGRGNNSSSSNTVAVPAPTATTSLNPFAEEPPKSPTSPNAKPFVTASSTLNPFAEDVERPHQGEEEEEEEEAGVPSPAAGRITIAGSGGTDGHNTTAVATGTAGPGTSSESRPKKPPPLPPRRPASSSPTHSQSQSPLAPRSRAATAGTEGVESSRATSPRSTVSSTTCDSSGAGNADGSEEGGLDAGSVESSAGSEGSAGGGKAKKKYMVVNKDTGQKFDVRELEQHLPADDYAHLPSRTDVVDPETTPKPQTSPGESPESTEAEAATAAAAVVRSDSPSPRSSISATVAASVSAAVGSTTSTRKKAKSLGSMMRKKLVKVKTAAGAAAAAAGGGGGGGGGATPSPASPSSFGEGATAGSGSGSGSGGGVDVGVDRSSGGAGDRGSMGGMGAAAKAARGALAGIRVSFKGKEASESLAGLMLFQELRCHEGPIWTAAFNQSGQFLATAGQDARILLHRVGDTREVVEDEGESGGGDVSSNGVSSAGRAVRPGTHAAAATDSGPEGNLATGSVEKANEVSNSSGGGGGGGGGGAHEGKGSSEAPEGAPDGSSRRPVSGEEGSPTGGGRRSSRRAAATVMIDPTPWQVWEAHRGDVVALSWSRNDFLLSASLDKTVRLWHTTQANCLYCFQHAETVTSVDFHPLLEHYFLSGCFDKKIRVWNIRDGRVQEWQQAPDMVTAAKFSLDGQMIVAGLYMGQVLFYQTEGMRYFTQIECRNRRGNKKRGCKVSGFAFKRTSVSGIVASGKDAGIGGGTSRPPGSSPSGGRLSEPAGTPAFGGPVGRGGGGGGGAGSHVPEQLLVTTNDSRLRLYNTDDFGMNAKYKGFVNDTLQITATFSEDGKQIICGSENGKVYVWSTGVFATTSPSTLPGVGGGGGGGGGSGGVAAAMAAQQPAAAAAAAAAASPTGAPTTQKDTNQRHESFYATSEAPKIVTTACFVPETTSRACVEAVRGALSKSVAESGGYCGCMILATDYNGSVRVYCKSAVLLS